LVPAALPRVVGGLEAGCNVEDFGGDFKGKNSTRTSLCRGLTCGIEDLVLTPDADEERREILKEADVAGPEVVAKFVGVSDVKDSNAVKVCTRRVWLVIGDRSAGLLT
jgi:hypothetical protein